MLVNTVKIKHGESYRIINESDFKHGQHELYEGEKLSVAPDNVTLDLKVGITPDLQKTIDDMKNECQRVENNNVQLKALLVEREAIEAQLRGELKGALESVSALTEQLAKYQKVDYSKLKVDEIKELLKSKNIEIPPDVKLKEDLLALLPKE
ncbi:hypothetical protein F971_01980 [Acinetobacter vivianii]|uniref:HeH/LEM domain-containing protein n=1 Tax=Acinetobacter vivianii TaxID=1776742 RepID=N8W5K8_9GAMM|nr:hypothetical protein [Acinetobacter vivianii]ENU92093.1 hypothetical protein F971_01980 [Acinetobacter vivianii]